jgi:serine phosphatase RsbU (regulator of sigma subunit)
MGHGAGSALAAATVGGALHTLAHHVPLRGGADVARLVADLNRTITVTFQGRFMVALGAVWMPEAEPFVDVVSAAFPPMLMEPEGKPAHALVASGDPVGLEIGSFKCAAHRFPMAPGDRLVCFTDGCYEFLMNGQPFRRRRLHDIFGSVRQSSPEDACREVSAQLKRLRGTEYSEDDVTFVVLDRV